jgi:DNA polymerase III epsilon subunit-like protein
MKQRGVVRGYFKYLFAVDCETTGLCFKNYSHNENVVHNPDSGEHHQALSWGIMIVDADTFEVVEKMYIPVKWNENTKAQFVKDQRFGSRAQEIHGLTYKYLEEHGVDETDAVVTIGKLITKYFGTDNAIKVLGHNVTFDIQFLRELFQRYGINLKFGSRLFDSNSLSFGTVGAWNSDDLFKTMGFEHRQSHNALEDIELTVEMFRITRALWKKAYPDLVSNPVGK